MLQGNKARLSQLGELEDSEQVLLELRQLVEGLKLHAKKLEDLKSWVRSLAGLEADKLETLLELAEEHREDFQQAQRVDTYANLPVLTAFNWRLELEVASREKKQSFVPNFLTSFTFESHQPNASGQMEKKTEVLCLNADAAMIRKVGEEMKTAHSFPRGITYRKLNRGLK